MTFDRDRERRNDDVYAEHKAAMLSRLEGIDAPESRQSFGTKSKQALSEMVFGKAVTVKKTGTDRYGIQSRARQMVEVVSPVSQVSYHHGTEA